MLQRKICFILIYKELAKLEKTLEEYQRNYDSNMDSE